MELYINRGTLAVCAELVLLETQTTEPNYKYLTLELRYTVVKFKKKRRGFVPYSALLIST